MGYHTVIVVKYNYVKSCSMNGTYLVIGIWSFQYMLVLDWQGKRAYLKTITSGFVKSLF